MFLVRQARHHNVITNSSPPTALPDPPSIPTPNIFYSKQPPNTAHPSKCLPSIQCPTHIFTLILSLPICPLQAQLLLIHSHRIIQKVILSVCPPQPLIVIRLGLGHELQWYKTVSSLGMSHPLRWLDRLVKVTDTLTTTYMHAQIFFFHIKMFQTQLTSKPCSKCPRNVGFSVESSPQVCPL